MSFNLHVQRIVALAGLVFSALVHGSALAQTWVSLDGSPAGTPPTVTLDPASDEDTTTFTVVTHGFYVTPIVDNATTYHRIVIPSPLNTGIAGYDFDVNTSPRLCGEYGIGLPELPYDGELVGIVTDADWATASAIAEESVDYTEWLGLPIKVHPQQPEGKDCDCCNIPAPFQIDANFYATWPGFFPSGLININAPDAGDLPPTWLTTKLGVCGMNICQFSPSTSTLRINKRIRATINHIGNLLPPVLRPDNYPDVDAIYQRFMVNWSKVKTVANNLVQRRYLIITHDDYANAILPLKNAKIADGFTVTVKGVPTDVAATPAAIKTEITNFYNAARSVFRPIVLLVGDVDKIPSNAYQQSDNSETGPSDSMYAMVKGDDWFPDLLIGRLSTDNAAMLTTTIARILNYEQQNIKGNWTTRTLLASHLENFPGKYTAAQRATKTNVLDKAVPVPTTAVCEGGAAANNNNAFVTTTINNWRGVVGYRGHGKAQVWDRWDTGSNSWTIAMVQALRNGCRTPVVISTACKTSKIDTNDSIGEEWLQQSKANGAVAHYGASQDVWTELNHQFNERIYRERYIEGNSRLGWVAHTSSIMFLKTKVKEKPKERTKGTDFASYYILLGDPDMEIRIAQLAGASAPCCLGDITGGGSVNIDSLVAVITNWGAGAGNPADVTGNGVVNIDDLVFIITNWGPCP